MKKTKLLTFKNAIASLIVGAAGILQSSAQITIVTVQDSISADTHWTADKQYFLKGYVYVVNGTTLTIDADVIIKGDKNTKGSLIIERGAKIMAQGTVSEPIVFTSNQPAGQRTYGDWGGVILCGKAYCNWTGGHSQVEGGPRSLYGGTDAHDNSGVLSFVRIEFAGVAFSPNNEINGLTLCSVGDATQIDHIQVSYSGDDSYEWFGGTVNGKYLVAYRGWDDDFDTDNGYRGNNQFVVGIRDPFAADVSGSKAFESDSYQPNNVTIAGTSGDTSGLTRPVFSNATVIGPLVSPTSSAYDPQFVAAAHIRRGSAISIMNSLLIGYPAGILFDESAAGMGSTTRNYDILGSGPDSIGQLRNNIIAGIPTNGAPAKKELVYVINGARSLTSTSADVDTAANTPFAPFTGPYDFYQTSAYHNAAYATEQTSVILGNPYNLANPNLIPNSTSPIVYNSKSLPAYVNTHFGGADHFANGKKYPFNTALPINTDTSNYFASYNAPGQLPGFTSSKLSSSFFTRTNYVGAFAGTGTTTDNWMNGWCNFDPVNTDYSHTLAGIKNNDANAFALTVYPNPAHDEANISFVLEAAGYVQLAIYDITGKFVKSVSQTRAAAGRNTASIDIQDITNGIYFINITTEKGSQTSKMVVLKNK